MLLGRSQLVNSNILVRTAAATLFVATATLLTSALWLIVDRPVSTPIFLGAIVLSAWVCGLRLGIFSAFIATFIFDYYFISTSRGATDLYEVLMRMLVFLIQGSLVALLADRLRVATDELSESREEMRRLSRHQQTLREAEQKRIAREIHDELGQALTGLKLDLHLMSKSVSVGGEAISREKMLSEIDDLSKRIDTTIGTVRRISSEIRPSILDDFGLVAAIEWQARQFEQKTGVECIFRSSSENINLDPDAGSAIFRIFQEALTNVARHAGAAKVKVMIDALADRVQMRIEDDGRGIDARALAAPRSLGILGMRERARLIGADLSIDRLDDGGGTVVQVILPANQTAQHGAA